MVYVIRFQVDKDAKLHIETKERRSGDPVQVIEYEFEGRTKRRIVLLHNRPFYAKIIAWVWDPLKIYQHEIRMELKSKKFTGVDIVREFNKKRLENPQLFPPTFQGF